MSLIPNIRLSDGLGYQEIVKSANFDLYLIDFSLVNDIQGPQVIKEIRDNNKNLTDIILYSTTNENLYNKISELDLDGVYICQRRDLTLKTEKILNKLEKRMLNPLSLRGIVLHNYSDIELQLKELLVKKYRELGEDDKKIVQDKVLKMVEGGVERFKVAIEDCKQEGDFFENLLLGKNFLFNMGQKLTLLEFYNEKQYLKLVKKDMHLLRSLNDIRNELGHSKIVEKDNEMVVLNLRNEEVVYTQEKCNSTKGKIIHAFEILASLSQ
ncbi:MAG: hypothetical protein ACI4M5_03375 [Christensenellales bacterium]